MPQGAELALDRGGIGLRGAATELFDVKRRHGCVNMIAGIPRRAKLCGRAERNKGRVGTTPFRSPATTADRALGRLESVKQIHDGLSQSSVEEHLTVTMNTVETSELYSTADSADTIGPHLWRAEEYSPSALVDPKVSIVIPVYNEKNTIDEILRRVIETETRKEVIIVDDCSNDGTRERLKTMASLQAKGDATAPATDGSDGVPLRDLRFFFQAQNQGKGAALRRGFAQVTGDIVLVQDADLEYDPRDYPKLLEPIVDGRADVVYGSRFLGGPQRVHYFWHYVANMALTLLSDIATNLKLTDMETCYKVFRREVLQGIESAVGPVWF